MNEKIIEKEEMKKKKVTEVRGNGGRSGDARREYLYRGTSPPSTNIHICTGWDTRYK
jgi:hypothetical protein